MLVILIAILSRADLAQIRANNFFKDTIRKRFVRRVLDAKETLETLFGLLLNDLLIALEKLEYNTNHLRLNLDNEVI